MTKINRRGMVQMITLALLIIGAGSCGSEKQSEPMILPVSIVLPEVNKPLPDKRSEENVAIGEMIDEYRGIPVYYNGSPYQSQGRHVSPGGYNYGMKWQCVEFVKRYYYNRLKHEMPDTYGHAKDFFNRELRDGDFNKQRNLYQFINGGVFKPAADDIVVYDGDDYGHVAIITEVGEDYLMLIQQNVGTATRHKIPFAKHDNHYYIMNRNVIGFLGRRTYE